MKKLKSNKILLVLTTIIIIGIILIFYGLIRYFYLGNGTDKYGNRLDDINNYEITKEDKNEIINLYKDITAVGEVELETSGKIIYLTIDFVENIRMEDAKSYAVKSLESFSEEIKSYYDIQYILTGKTLEEGSLFPTMGYKNKSNSQIVWVKN